MKTISIIIPVHNERENVPLIYERIKRIFEDKGTDYGYEIIFINDGSDDMSDDRMKSIAEGDSQVKYLEFSRNFGKEIATTAGLHHARGHAAIMIDSDLQHPPELIFEFVEKWERGAEIVVGIRQQYQREGLFKRLGSSLFYKMMNLIGESYVIPHATDFRLVDRKVIDVFNQFSERSRITRGLFDWLGFRRDFVEFDAPPRMFGQPSYSLVKLVQLTLNSFISLSLFPLRLAGYLGLIITITSGPLGLFILINRYILRDPFGFAFSGTAALAVFILFLIGVVLICLGLMAMYIAFIHREVLNRPMYVIRESRNIKQ